MSTVKATGTGAATTTTKSCRSKTQLDTVTSSSSDDSHRSRLGSSVLDSSSADKGIPVGFHPLRSLRNIFFGYRRKEKPAVLVVTNKAKSTDDLPEQGPVKISSSAIKQTRRKTAPYNRVLSASADNLLGETEEIEWKPAPPPSKDAICRDAVLRDVRARDVNKHVSASSSVSVAPAFINETPKEQRDKTHVPIDTLSTTADVQLGQAAAVTDEFFKDKWSLQTEHSDFPSSSGLKEETGLSSDPNFNDTVDFDAIGRTCHNLNVSAAKDKLAVKQKGKRMSTALLLRAGVENPDTKEKLNSIDETAEDPTDDSISGKIKKLDTPDKSSENICKPLAVKTVELDSKHIAAGSLVNVSRAPDTHRKPQFLIDSKLAQAAISKKLTGQTDSCCGEASKSTSPGLNSAIKKRATGDNQISSKEVFHGPDAPLGSCTSIENKSRDIESKRCDIRSNIKNDCSATVTSHGLPGKVCTPEGVRRASSAGQTVVVSKNVTQGTRITCRSSQVVDLVVKQNDRERVCIDSVSLQRPSVDKDNIVTRARANSQAAESVVSDKNSDRMRDYSGARETIAVAKDSPAKRVRVASGPSQTDVAKKNAQEEVSQNSETPDMLQAGANQRIYARLQQQEFAPKVMPRSNKRKDK